MQRQKYGSTQESDEPRDFGGFESLWVNRARPVVPGEMWESRVLCGISKRAISTAKGLRRNNFT
jgi:hypothetical protein